MAHFPFFATDMIYILQAYIQLFHLERQKWQIKRFLFLRPRKPNLSLEEKFLWNNMHRSISHNLKVYYDMNFSSLLDKFGASWAPKENGSFLPLFSRSLRVCSSKHLKLTETEKLGTTGCGSILLTRKASLDSSSVLGVVRSSAARRMGSRGVVSSVLANYKVI